MATGCAYFDRREPDGRTLLPVPLAFGSGRVPRRHSDFVASVERLAPAEIAMVQGVPCVTALRAIFDEARRPRDWRESVVSIEMAVAAKLVSLPCLEQYVEEHATWRRTARLRRVLRFCVVGARSPEEVRLRLVWEVDAGLPRPLVNTPIYDLNARHVCTPDLFDPVAGMVVEYDGSAHRKGARHTKDVRREEDCRRLGLEYCKITAGDSRLTVVNRLLSTRARAKFLPEESRAWLLKRPVVGELPDFWMV